MFSCIARLHRQGRRLPYGKTNRSPLILRSVLDKQAFMRACREGGLAIEHALRQLDRNYFAALYKESVRGLRDAEAARDLVQETFIKVWQRCALFRGDSELLPWIKAILRHGLLDRLRTLGREVAIDTEPNAEIEARLAELSMDTVSRPEDDARRRERDECFRRCWQQFERASPTHALVLSWVVEDALSHAQIAELLDRSPGATREFISQCRKRARIHLAEWYEQSFK